MMRSVQSVHAQVWLPHTGLSTLFFCKVHKSKIYSCYLTKPLFRSRVSCKITALISEKESRGDEDSELSVMQIIHTLRIQH